jgi:hypothetical protein
MEYYLAVIFGCFVYLLFQLNAVYNLPEFVWKIFIRTNWIPIVINLSIGCICVYAKKEMATIYPITFISALMLGFGGQVFFKKISNIFDSKVNTVVGLS